MSQQNPIIKAVPNAVRFADGTLRLDRVRLSYPHVIEPWAGTRDDGSQGEPKFSGVFLLPKKTHAAAKDLCKERIEELLREARITVGADRKFLRDGDLSGKPENTGHWTVNASEDRAPILRAPSKQPIRKGQPVTIGGKERRAEEVFYGGCWVSAIIRPWVQNNRYGKRINAGLSAVMFVEDGEPFGQGRISEEEIDSRFDQLEAVDNGGFDDPAPSGGGGGDEDL